MRQLNTFLLPVLMLAIGHPAPAYSVAKAIAKETRAFGIVRAAEFYYEFLEMLPTAPETIVFGEYHEDEDLEVSCSKPKKHTFIAGSSSPAFRKILALVQNAQAKVLLNKTHQTEVNVTLKLEKTGEEIVAKFLFKKGNNNLELHAEIRTYGQDETLPEYVLNFLRALILTNTVWQNHASKIVGGTAVLASVGLATVATMLKKRRITGGVRVRRAVVQEVLQQPLQIVNPHANFVDTPYVHLVPVAAEDGRLPLTANAFQDIFLQIFEIFNVHLVIANDIGHWANVCRRLHNVLAPYGGFEVLRVNFSQGATQENLNLWKLFFNPHNGILRRASDATATCSSGSRIGLFKTFHDMMDLRLLNVQWVHGQERIAWTYAA